MTELPYFNELMNLKVYALSACKEIYENFTEEEIRKEAKCIQRAWEQGRDLAKLQGEVNSET